MAANTALVEPKVYGESLLARKAIVILPSVAEQHGEGHLVAGAELFGLEQEVRDLGEAPVGGSVGAVEDDVFVFEDVTEAAHLIEVHIGPL